jgi:cytochrome c-type biogenesis protein CcmF
MHELGYLTILVALVVATFAGVASVVGYRRGHAKLQQAGYAGAFAVAGLVTVAALCMIYLFVAHDFSVKYVHRHSDRSMPMFYIVTAFWGGQEGSLLFWLWILVLYGAVALWLNRDQVRLIPYANATLMATAVFFLVLLIFPANPFATYLGEAPTDGRGLNPLLQNPYMIIHPPTMYLGYIGMTIPFAFGIASLASGQTDETWLRVTRRWTLVAWFFLSIGLILGKLWAYEELGWGGYWAWDPVENAGFLPWLTCTAFLHSVMIQERRGMFKKWNMTLVIFSFAFTIVGTFLTRSGVVQSVHSFAQSDIGNYFIGFLIISMGVGFLLMWVRRKELHSEVEVESMLSREFAFGLNNWILLGMAFFVLIATIFPSLSDYFIGEKITVGQPFFNQWMIPLGLTLLFLCGVGPLISWRKASGDSMKKQFMWPTITGLVAGGVSIALGAGSGGPLPVLTYLFCGFVTATIGQEYIRGIRVRMRNANEGAMDAFMGLMSRAKRRYGGYVIHFGVVLMFFGWAGNAYKIERDVTLARGEVASIGPYVVRYDDLRFGETRHRGEVTAYLTILNRAGRELDTQTPAKWFYRKSEQPTTEIAIRTTLTEDLYVVLAGWDPGTGAALLRLVINPFVLWVWLGSGFLILGIAIVLWPDRHVKRHLGSTRRGAAGIAVVLLALAGLVGAPRSAAAQPGHEEVGRPSTSVELSPELDKVARELNNELICLCGTCSRQTLHDCTCGYAAQRREEIRRRLSDGATKQDLLDYYIAHYGTLQVLTTPPDTGFFRLAWALPYAGIGVGGLALFIAGIRWSKRNRTRDPDATPADMQAPETGLSEDETESYRDRLADELEDLD